MARDKYRRQVTGKTAKDDIISVPRVSHNGNGTWNAKSKGCFGWVQSKRESTITGKRKKNKS